MHDHRSNHGHRSEEALGNQHAEHQEREHNVGSADGSLGLPRPRPPQAIGLSRRTPSRNTTGLGTFAESADDVQDVAGPPPELDVDALNPNDAARIDDYETYQPRHRPIRPAEPELLRHLVTRVGQEREGETS